MNNLEKKYQHIYASFILMGKDLDPENITESLGVTPHKTFRRGDAKTETEVWKHGYWELSSNDEVDSPDLTSHIRWIVNQLHPQKIRDTLKSDTIKARLSCLWIMPSSHEVLILDSELLQKISSLGISLELDLYDDN